MEKLEGEDGEGEGFSVSDEQLSGVKTTSNEQAAEAQTIVTGKDARRVRSKSAA